MATANFFGGGIGGVGKTLCTLTAATYHVIRELDFALFDGDWENPNVYLSYPASESEADSQDQVSCTIAYFTESDEHLQSVNEIFNAAGEKPTLVNLPAGTFRSFTDWLERKNVFRIAKAGGVDFKMWFLTDGSTDSLGVLVNSLQYFDGRMPHVVVKNHGRGRDWSKLESKKLQALLDAHNVKVIDFPEFTGKRELEEIRTQHIPFEQFLKKDLGLFEKLSVRDFLDKAWDAFDKAGGFSNGD